MSFYIQNKIKCSFTAAAFSLYQYVQDIKKETIIAISIIDSTICWDDKPEFKSLLPTCKTTKNILLEQKMLSKTFKSFLR